MAGTRLQCGSTAALTPRCHGGEMMAHCEHSGLEVSVCERQRDDKHNREAAAQRQREYFGKEVGREHSGEITAAAVRSWRSGSTVAVRGRCGGSTGAARRGRCAGSMAAAVRGQCGDNTAAAQ